MKYILPSLIVGLTLALAGCAPPQTLVQITTTRPIVTPLPETQTPLATPVTEIPLTFTPISPMVPSAPIPVPPIAAIPLCQLYLSMT